MGQTEAKQNTRWTLEKIAKKNRQISKNIRHKLIEAQNLVIEVTSPKKNFAKFRQNSMKTLLEELE